MKTFSEENFESDLNFIDDLQAIPTVNMIDDDGWMKDVI